MSDADYSTMTDDEFDEILHKMVSDAGAMSVPGVYDLVREHYNNEVLDQWTDENPERAYPNDTGDEKEAEDET